MLGVPNPPGACLVLSLAPIHSMPEPLPVRFPDDFIRLHAIKINVHPSPPCTNTTAAELFFLRHSRSCYQAAFSNKCSSLAAPGRPCHSALACTLFAVVAGCVSIVDAISLTRLFPFRLCSALLLCGLRSYLSMLVLNLRFFAYAQKVCAGCVSFALLCSAYLIHGHFYLSFLPMSCSHLGTLIFLSAMSCVSSLTPLLALANICPSLALSTVYRTCTQCVSHRLRLAIAQCCCSIQHLSHHATEWQVHLKWGRPLPMVALSTLMSCSDSHDTLCALLIICAVASDSHIHQLHCRLASASSAAALSHGVPCVPCFF